jgi:Ser/Thr protein kinase RdoA (MazF antagonist)
MVASSILNQILNIFGCESSKLQLMGGYFNNVYELSLEEPLVIKIFNKEICNEQLILSEIEWTQYLNDNEVNTVIPIMISTDSYINQLPSNHYFVAYKKVKGEKLDVYDNQTWNEKMFSVWGKNMAKMHCLAKSFEGKYKRPTWNDHEIYKLDIDQMDLKIQEKWETFFKEQETMAKTSNSYGIIHGDLHHHNILNNHGELTIIDFGDSEYNWFAYDVAISVYHAVQTVNDANKRREFAKLFFNSFMDGYSQNFSVDEILKNVDYYVDFRHLYSYVYHIQYSDKEKLNKGQLKYLQDMKLSLIDYESYLGISLV